MECLHMRFHQWKLLNFKWNIIEICSLGSNWQQTTIGSDNGLSPNRRQAIIWINDGLLYRRIYVTRLQWVKLGFYDKYWYVILCFLMRFRNSASYLDELVQEIANALELRLSCINRWSVIWMIFKHSYDINASLLGIRWCPNCRWQMQIQFLGWKYLWLESNHQINDFINKMCFFSFDDNLFIFVFQLHIACANGFSRVSQLLIKSGVDCNGRDNQGWTPLHAAAKYGQVRVVVHPYDYNEVIKWKYFLRYWPFVQGIHRSPVNSPHKGQCRGALMFSLIFAWMNGWVNNHDSGDLRCHHAHYDVTVMIVWNNF